MTMTVKKRHGGFALIHDDITILFSTAVIQHHKTESTTFREILLNGNRDTTINIGDDYNVLQPFFDAEVPMTVVYE